MRWLVKVNVRALILQAHKICHQGGAMHGTAENKIFRKDLLKGPMMILSTTIGGSRVKDVMV